jgi:ABC-type ATPase involved in cell division
MASPSGSGKESALSFDFKLIKDRTNTKIILFIKKNLNKSQRKQQPFLRKASLSFQQLLTGLYVGYFSSIKFVLMACWEKHFLGHSSP